MTIKVNYVVSGATIRLADIEDMFAKRTYTEREFSVPAGGGVYQRRWDAIARKGYVRAGVVKGKVKSFFMTAPVGKYNNHINFMSSCVLTAGRLLSLKETEINEILKVVRHISAKESGRSPFAINLLTGAWGPVQQIHENYIAMTRHPAMQRLCPVLKDESKLFSQGNATPADKDKACEVLARDLSQKRVTTRTSIFLSTVFNIITWIEFGKANPRFIARRGWKGYYSFHVDQASAKVWARSNGERRFVFVDSPGVPATAKRVANPTIETLLNS